MRLKSKKKKKKCEKARKSRKSCKRVDAIKDKTIVKPMSKVGKSKKKKKKKKKNAVKSKGTLSREAFEYSELHCRSLHLSLSPRRQSKELNVEFRSSTAASILQSPGQPPQPVPQKSSAFDSPRSAIPRMSQTERRKSQTPGSLFSP
jgi:hypothetical protein